MNLDKLKNNKHVQEFQKGLKDIQLVGQEGNFKLFLKQFMTVLVLFLLVRYIGAKNENKVRGYNDKIESIHLEQSSEKEYQDNKDKLLSLEPMFPDVSEKNEWLLRQILGIFQEKNMSPEVVGNQTEDAANPGYVLTGQQVNTVMGFRQFAEFLAGIESRDEFIKITSFSLEKDDDRNRLGSNKISMRFNTAFPKEKIAKSLFKDYDRIMAQRQKDKAGDAAKGGN